MSQKLSLQLEYFVNLWRKLTHDFEFDRIGSSFTLDVGGSTDIEATRSSLYLLEDKTLVGHYDPRRGIMLYHHALQSSQDC